MSRDNIELVRSIYADWERGDWSRADWADPDIEFIVADGPTPVRFNGVAEMADGWRDFISTWQDWRSRAEGYRELDEERVLVLERYVARGKTSGLDLQQIRADAAVLFHVSAGKVSRLIVYMDRENALADLGLEE